MIPSWFAVVVMRLIFFPQSSTSNHNLQVPQGDSDVTQPPENSGKSCILHVYEKENHYGNLFAK